MNWKLRFRIPRWWVGVQLKIAFKKREGVPVVGICNKVGHRYVPFFDYDFDNKLAIFQEIRSLQEKHFLGNAYFFKTKAGYHVIFLDLMTYDEWLYLLNDSTCDKYYKEVPQMNNSKMWVLRVTPKKNNNPEFETVLYNQQIRPVSTPHRRILEERGVPNSILQKNILFEEETEKTITYARYEA